MKQATSTNVTEGSIAVATELQMEDLPETPGAEKRCSVIDLDTTGQPRRR